MGITILVFPSFFAGILEVFCHGVPGGGCSGRNLCAAVGRMPGYRKEETYPLSLLQAIHPKKHKKPRITRRANQFIRYSCLHKIIFWFKNRTLSCTEQDFVRCIPLPTPCHGPGRALSPFSAALWGKFCAWNKSIF